jgi:hypothetical protein
MESDFVCPKDRTLPATAGLEEPDEQHDDQGNDQGADQGVEAVDLASGLAGGLVDVLDSDGAESVEQEPEDNGQNNEPEDVAAGVRAVAVRTTAAGDVLDGLLDREEGRSAHASEGVNTRASVRSRHVVLLVIEKFRAISFLLRRTLASIGIVPSSQHRIRTANGDHKRCSKVEQKSLIFSCIRIRSSSDVDRRLFNSPHLGHSLCGKIPHGTRPVQLRTYQLGSASTDLESRLFDLDRNDALRSFVPAHDAQGAGDQQIHQLIVPLLGSGATATGNVLCRAPGCFVQSLADGVHLGNSRAPHQTRHDIGREKARLLGLY